MRSITAPALFAVVFLIAACSEESTSKQEVTVKTHNVWEQTIGKNGIYVDGPRDWKVKSTDKGSHKGQWRFGSDESFVLITHSIADLVTMPGKAMLKRLSIYSEIISDVEKDEGYGKHTHYVHHNEPADSDRFWFRTRDGTRQDMAGPMLSYARGVVGIGGTLFCQAKLDSKLSLESALKICSSVRDKREPAAQ